MNGLEVEVEIMDSAASIERRVCRRAVLADGAAAVVWRGAAYRLLPGNRIDIGPVDHPTPPTSRYVILRGEETTRVLLQGSAADRTAARRAIEAAGVVVLRDGRWLGDPVGGIVFDHFLVCAGAPDDVVLDDSLGTPIAPMTADASGMVALLEQRLVDARADLAALETRLREATARPAAAVAPLESPGALEAALTELAAVRARLDGVPAAPPNTKLLPEVAGLLGALRPDVRLLRDWLEVAVGEFSERGGIWRALGELPVNGGRPAASWKTLQGVEGWIERHVSTGRDNQGRLYARFEAGQRCWAVLLGWKSDQSRDIAWLKRQATHTNEA